MEAAAAGVQGDELGGEEVGSDDGEDDEAGVELLALAEATAIGAALDEDTISADVRQRRQAMGGGTPQGPPHLGGRGRGRYPLERDR